MFCLVFVQGTLSIMQFFYAAKLILAVLFLFSMSLFYLLRTSDRIGLFNRIFLPEHYSPAYSIRRSYFLTMVLTLFKMGFSGAAHGWRGTKRPPP